MSVDQLARAGSDVIVTPALSIPWSALQVSYSRSSGPGGQNVNKVNSRVQIEWQPGHLPAEVLARLLGANASRVQNDGALQVSSQRYRDQHRNQEDCLDKLRELVLAALIVAKRRRPTRPTRGSVERRLKSKQANSQRKQSRRNSGEE